MGCITGRTVAKGQKMREQQRAQEQVRRAQPTKVGTAAPARVHSGTEYMYVPPRTK
jgi:hypothetical protein